MLSKPNHGWTTITVFGKTLGHASYVDDVANMTLDAFINYFTNNEFGLSLSYDAEGYNFGLFLWNDDLYSIDSRYDSVSSLEPKTFAPIHDTMSILAKELVSDVLESLTEWSFWNPGTESEEEAVIEREILELKCLVLQQKLKEKEGVKNES